MYQATSAPEVDNPQMMKNDVPQLASSKLQMNGVIDYSYDLLAK